MQYHYKIDKKCTTWVRYHHTVEAESQAEADALAIQMAQENDAEPDWSEEMCETSEEMTPADNEGAPTVEILRGNETIWMNATYGNETEKQEEEEKEQE